MTHKRSSQWTRGIWTLFRVANHGHRVYFQLVRDGARSACTDHPILYDDNTVGYGMRGVPIAIQNRVRRTMIAHKRSTP